MKNKLKIILLSGMILSLGACTNIQDTFTGTPAYTEIEKSNFNVQEEIQLFAMGSYQVNESGTAVAKMKAKGQAEIYLKKQIFDQSIDMLNLFFSEVHIKNIIISKNTVEDLADLVSSELTKDAITTNSWNDQGKEFVVLAVDKTKIPEKVKEKFVIHLQSIIDDLDGAITKVSNEYLEITKPTIAITEEIAEVKAVDETKNIGPKNPVELEDSIESSNSKKNSEPEVFLDDF